MLRNDIKLNNELSFKFDSAILTNMLLPKSSPLVNGNTSIELTMIIRVIHNSDVTRSINEQNIKIEKNRLFNCTIQFDSKIIMLFLCSNTA